MGLCDDGSTPVAAQSQRRRDPWLAVVGPAEQWDRRLFPLDRIWTV